MISLILETTLDKGQLVNFIDALRNPVHLTQGPPGTGKSYLGVVLVRALLRIRDLWMQQNPSVGHPPILVLSYKNHAADEFLCDFEQAERSSGTIALLPATAVPPAPVLSCCTNTCAVCGRRLGSIDDSHGYPRRPAIGTLLGALV
jgi:hypothetical protein